MTDSHDPSRSSPADAERGEAGATLPDFAPVPRHRHRHDGWTPARQRGFIEALADTGSVKAAAQSVGMTAVGAYLLRRHPQAGAFRAAWEAALALGVRRLEDVAMERALHGVEVPVYHFGAVVGTRRVYNDRLLMFLLRNRAPKRFAADSHHNADAATRGQLERLKKQWRAEWEAEARAERARSGEEALHRLNAKLQRMHERELAAMSPRTRAAWEAYNAARAEDRLALPAPDEDEAETDGDGEDRP